MKKLKNMWNQNRVLVVLFIIVVVCLCIVLGVMMKYFFGTSKSSYGDRLEGIENVLLTDEIQNDFLDNLKSDELVHDATIKSRGKIIYITLIFEEAASLVEAESKALSSLSLFEETYLEYYDFHYTLKQEATESCDGFLIMGANNNQGNGIVWNNNTPVSLEE